MVLVSETQALLILCCDIFITAIHAYIIDKNRVMHKAQSNILPLISAQLVVSGDSAVMVQFGVDPRVSKDDN